MTLFWNRGLLGTTKPVRSQCLVTAGSGRVWTRSKSGGLRCGAQVMCVPVCKRYFSHTIDVGYYLFS